MKTHKIIVKGRVQGVGFRYYTRRTASLYGVKGKVRNKADGSVEIIAQAPEINLQEFLKKIKKGPQLSRVTNIIKNNLGDKPNYENFKITY